MENKFESDFKCHPLTKEQQDEAFRAFDQQQQKSLERLVQMIESDPVLRAQHEAARRSEHLAKFGDLDLSALEKRTVTGRTTTSGDTIEHISPTFRHTSGKTRGVVYSRPIMADNLPRDGRIKVDKMLGERMLQTDVHMGDVQTSDLSEALLQTMAYSFELRPEQKQVAEEIKDRQITIVDEAAFIPNTVHLPQHYLQSEKGPECLVGPTDPCGRELRVEYKAQGGKWSAERRDRAATSASDRKKLRAKTRAQKKARRKHR